MHFICPNVQGAQVEALPILTFGQCKSFGEELYIVAKLAQFKMMAETPAWWYRSGRLLTLVKELL